jgi:hypothetical protein
MDAITLLNTDHEKLRILFIRYQWLVNENADPVRKAELAARICLELSLLAQIEEEIFYPALRAPVDGVHTKAMALVEEIWETSPADARYDAMIGRLGLSIEHHIRDVRREVFPKARGTLDLDALGAALLERKHALVRDVERAPRRKSEEARTT